MDNISNTNNTENKDYTNLFDVMDVKHVKSLQDFFSNAVGLTSFIVDVNNFEPIIQPCILSSFTTKYLKSNNRSLSLYKNNLRRALEGLTEENKAETYTCHTGLTNICVPIFLNGSHVATFLTGQVLTRNYDKEELETFASSIGADSQEFIKDLNKVPFLGFEKIKDVSNLIEFMIKNLVSKYDTILSRSIFHSEITEETKVVNSMLDSFSETSNELNLSQSELISEIENINVLLTEINSIVKSVSSLADETQMISFNASIEAARAGEQGKSFTVIAGEIRRLSEQSKKTVSNIQNFTANIQTCIGKTSDHSKACMESINEELKEINKIKTSMYNISEKMDSLK